MQRRRFLLQTGGLFGALITLGPRAVAHPVKTDLKITPLDKPDKEWRDVVSRSEFEVLFKDGTEPPGSSPLDKHYKEGTYICAACYLPLFESETKYDSGTGWPSFYRPIANRIGTKADFKLVWPRTEYHCFRCGGHQGHVFEDGPKPTGLRYCNNGLALKFVPVDKPLPGLRG